MERRHEAVADSQDMRSQDNQEGTQAHGTAPVVLEAWMAERLAVALESLALVVRIHSPGEHRAGKVDRVGMPGARVRRLFHVLDAKNSQGDRSHQVFVKLALTDLVAQIAPVCFLALAGKLPRADEYPRLVVPMILPIAQMLDADVFDWGRMLTLYIQNSR